LGTLGTLGNELRSLMMFATRRQPAEARGVEKAETAPANNDKKADELLGISSCGRRVLRPERAREESGEMSRVSVKVKIIAGALSSDWLASSAVWWCGVRFDRGPKVWEIAVSDDISAAVVSGSLLEDRRFLCRTQWLAITA
jgi:hypothetical protein